MNGPITASKINDNDFSKMKNTVRGNFRNYGD